MNRRIRAEEMLRNASFPGTMAQRERSRLSTPAAHSDLPIDPSPGPGASVSSRELRSVSPSKGHRKLDKKEFITTSPQPFRLSTASRADKKVTKMSFINIILLKLVYISLCCMESNITKPNFNRVFDSNRGK